MYMCSFQGSRKAKLDNDELGIPDATMILLGVRPTLSADAFPTMGSLEPVVIFWIVAHEHTKQYSAPLFFLFVLPSLSFVAIVPFLSIIVSGLLFC